MKVRRGRQFDPPGLRGFPIGGKDSSQHVQLERAKCRLVVLVEITPLADELRRARVARQHIRIDPRQLLPDL